MVLVFGISTGNMPRLLVPGFGFWGSAVLMFSVYTTQILWFWVLDAFKLHGPVVLGIWVIGF